MTDSIKHAAAVEALLGNTTGPAPVTGNSNEIIKILDTVMVVDDDESQLFSIKKVLERDYNLILCDRGQKALDTYAQHQDTIKAVLLDIRLPDIEGFEVFKRLKDMNENIPIIFITGYQSTYGDGFEVYREYRPHGYIVKNHENEIAMIKDTLANAVAYYNKLLESEGSKNMAMRNQFMAGLLHDLKNMFSPIQMIPTLMQRFMDKGDIEKAKDLMVRLKRSVDFFSANQMVLFNYAKGENIHVMWQSYPLKGLIEDFIALVAPTLEERVQIVTEFHNDQEMVTDKNIFTCQILLNIVKNAKEAFGVEGGQVTISTYTPIQYWKMLGVDAILSNLAPDTVVVVVADNGPGMPKELEDRLFTPYVTAGKKDGTGLGTWMVKNGTVDLLEGQLKLLNKPGVGVSYHLAFPNKEALL